MWRQQRPNLQATEQALLPCICCTHCRSFLLLFAKFFILLVCACDFTVGCKLKSCSNKGETDMRNQLNAEERGRSTTNVSKTGEGNRKKRVRKAALPQNKAAVPRQLNGWTGQLSSQCF
jgi:hypothetical protein